MTDTDKKQISTLISEISDTFLLLDTTKNEHRKLKLSTIIKDIILELKKIIDPCNESVISNLKSIESDIELYDANIERFEKNVSNFKKRKYDKLNEKSNQDNLLEYITAIKKILTIY